MQINRVNGQANSQTPRKKKLHTIKKRQQKIKIRTQKGTQQSHMGVPFVGAVVRAPT